MLENIQHTASIGRIVSSAAGALGGSEENGAIAELQKELEKALAPEIFHKDVALRREPDGLVISLREVGFFPSGSAELRLHAIPALRRITEVLLERPYEIRIEGHTDNVRIHTAQFASNWELSAARAIEVVRMMISEMGYAPQRLSVGGYGEFHPVAPNTTEEERALNRRVDVVILRRSILAAAHVVDVAKEAREPRSSPEPRGVPEPSRTDGKPSPAHGMSKVGGLGG
jgi:chemotaxis protein MotB